MVMVAFKTQGGYKTPGYISMGCFASLMTETGLRHYLPNKVKAEYEQKLQSEEYYVKFNPYSAQELWYKPVPSPALTYAEHHAYMRFMDTYPFFKRILGRPRKDGFYRANKNIPLYVTIAAWAALRAINENSHAIKAFAEFPSLVRGYIPSAGNIPQHILWWASFFVTPVVVKDRILWRLLSPMGSHNPMHYWATIMDMVNMHHHTGEFSGKPFKEHAQYSSYIVAMMKKDEKEAQRCGIIQIMHKGDRVLPPEGASLSYPYISAKTVAQNLVTLRDEYYKMEKMMFPNPIEGDK